MSSVYPGGLDSFDTNRTDATPNATTQAADHNDYADAINQIEATLGVDPQGSFSTVVDRLDNGGSQPEPAVTILTADDLYDLGSTPVELVAAPGADKVIIPENILYHYKPGATPFSGQLGMRWQWGDDSFDTADLTSVTLVVTGGEQVALHWPGADVDNTRGDPADIVGQPLNAVASPVPAVTGAATSGSVVDGGTGYAPGDTGNITQAGNGDATYEIDTVSGGGVVTAFTITAGGTGYSVGGGSPILTPGGAQPGAGSLCFVAIDAITPGAPADGTVEVTVQYRIIDLVLA